MSSYGSAFYGSSSYSSGSGGGGGGSPFTDEPTVPTFVVELGLSAPSTAFTLDDATEGVLDTGELADDFGYEWTDVSDDVILDAARLTTWRGSSRSQGPFWRYDGGTLNFVLDNTDGKYDPLNLDGPYVSAGVTDIRPSIPVRVRFALGDGIENVWLGKVESWLPDYQSATWTTVTVRCVDGVEFLQAADFGELPYAVGGGDTTPERIARILDRAGWPTGERDVPEYVGGVTLQSTTMAQSSWGQILLAADSDGGAVWLDRNGRVVYRTRGGLSPDPVLYFSSVAEDSAAYEDTDLEYDGVTFSNDRQQVWNRIRLARAGGTQVMVEDITAQALIREVRGYERSDLICEDDTQVMEIATWLLAQVAQLRTRIEQITIKATTDADLFESWRWWALVRLDIGNTIRVTHATPDGREIVCDGVVRGIGWEVGVREVTLTLSLEAAPAVYVPFTLDDAERGVLNTSTLALPAVVS